MESSPQQQHEIPAKGAASESAPPGSLSRFKKLAQKLFAVDREKFQEALRKDEEERRAKRGL